MPDAKGRFDHAISRIDQQYAQSREVIYSKSDDGRFLTTILKDSQSAALGAHAILAKGAIPHNLLNAEFFSGAFRAMLYKLGGPEQLGIQQSKLEELHDQFKNDLSTAQSELKLANETTDKDRQNWNHTFQKLEEGTAESIRQQKSDFDKLVEASKQKLEAIDKQYNEHMKLASPVSYWEAKGADHKSLTNRWYKIFGASVAVSVAFLIFIVLNVVPSGKPEPFEIGLLVVAATFVIWWLRIASRVLLSHIHLANDAAHRAIMAKTYLAMVKENDATDEKSREIVFTALFKPVSTGIVRDDAAPLTPMSLISRG